MMRSAGPYSAVGSLTLALTLQLAGCGGQPTAPAPEAAAVGPEPIAVTLWSDRTELFMEYPPLVAGGSGRAAVHLTEMTGFRPLMEGRVSITLTENGRIVEDFSTDGPSRPGIFGVDLTPQRAGMYTMTVMLESESLRDTHDVGEVTVYASSNDVPAPIEAPEPESVPFLKEQQWTLDFATELAAESEMRESLLVSGEVRPRSGGEVEVTAPVSGRITTASRIPVLGATVEAGQTLLTILPHSPAPADLPSLQQELAESETHLKHTRIDLERVERLLQAGAVPEWRLSVAEEEEALAVARFRAAGQRLEQYERTRGGQADAAEQSQFSVASPISGVVVEGLATAGANVEQGDRLFRIVAADRVHVVAHVPEAEASRATEPAGAEVLLPGSGTVLPVGNLVAVGRWVDPANRTLDVIYEADNSGRMFAVGQALQVRLFLSGATRAVTLPEDAVVDDGGRPVVFVQLDGESFARRPVRLGQSASGSVQVLEGIAPGDRVVTRGGYLIRLAALSPTIPAHGHVH